MKTFTIIRHAKSAWDDPKLTDIQRPLNHRGNEDAPRMAIKFSDKYGCDFKLISSNATRAYETARYFAKEMGFLETDIEVRPDLYHASEYKILDTLQGLDHSIDKAIIFCHNPGVTFFVNSYCGKNLSNIPTCGIIHCKSSISEWENLDESNIELIEILVPKTLADD